MVSTTPLSLVSGLLAGKPILPVPLADPFLLAEPDANYIYATNPTSANIPVYRSESGDTGTVEYLGDALPKVPDWTVQGFQWAPAVFARPDGTFVMYYATPQPPTTDGSPRRQCISRATSSAPGGPFVDVNHLAARFDGGGHVHAAGARITGTLAQAADAVRRAADDYFDAGG